MIQRRFVVLDRDGTINVERQYLSDPGTDPRGPAWHLSDDHHTWHAKLTPSGFRDFGKASSGSGSPFMVIVGDSFAFCYGVEVEECWGERLDALIGNGIDVVGFGQPGTGSLAHERVVKQYAPELHPKIILWQFFLNDMLDDWEFSQATPAGESSRGRFTVRIPTLYDIHQWLQRHSAVYAALRLVIIKSGVRDCRTTGFTYPMRQGHIYNLTSRWGNLSSKEISTGWTLTTEAILRTQALARDLGSELVVMLVPTKEQVYWDVVQQCPIWPEGYDPDQVNNRLKAFAEQNDIRVLDLLPGLRDVAQGQSGLYYTYDDHWTAEGNRVVADLVYRYLRAEGLLPGSTMQEEDKR